MAQVGLADPQQDFQFYSLYGQVNAVEGATSIATTPPGIQPLRIPSPYLDPAKWAAAFAKHWLLAYPAGATGFHHSRARCWTLTAQWVSS
jgi:hypothetical protein